MIPNVLINSVSLLSVFLTFCDGIYAQMHFIYCFYLLTCEFLITIGITNEE